jgi:hypothetical protein
MRSSFIAGLLVTLNTIKILSVAKKVFMANSGRRHFDLHVKFLPYLSDFN